MNKKGAGNVEFILAFMLFISFTVTAIYLFNPMKSFGDMESSKNYLANILIQNLSVELDSYSVAIDAPLSEEDIEIVVPGVDAEKMVKVFDYYGKEMISKRNLDSDSLCLTRSDDENFVTIYFSEDIEGETGYCTGSSEYKIASSNSLKVLSEKRIIALRENYLTDYNSLKKQFNIPEGMDFAFSFEFEDGEMISAERNIPVRREVFSDTKIEEVLREGGTSQFGYLMVKTW